MRAENLSNFRAVDEHPPGALTRRFSSWTALRAAATVKWPAHLMLWYAAVFAVSLYLAKAQNRPAAWIVAALCAVGVCEFLVASLADTLETYRHLFIFHAITDMTLCIAAVWGVSRAVRKY